MMRGEWDEPDTRRYLKLALELEDESSGYYLRLAVETDSSRAASAISEGVRDILTAHAMVLVERMKKLRSSDREGHLLGE